MTPAPAAHPACLVRPFLPAAAVGHVERVLAAYVLDIRIARPRRSKYGDHRPPAVPAAAHRISINSDLNPYAFLTTLLHEVAHAATWERHARRRRVRPHGPEWKREFRGLVEPIVAEDVLPSDVTTALERSLENPAAATCSDRGLVLALARYDATPAGNVRVEDLAEGTVFRIGTGQVFRAGTTVRTRRRCYDDRTGREYRVHGLLVVEPVAAGPTTSARRTPRRRS